MYRLPTARRKKKKTERLNLIPILDAVFIFIFFLLMSANFIKVFELSSDIPIVSSAPQPKNPKKPLALTISITNSKINVLLGMPSRLMRSFGKNAEGKYDTESLHIYLINLKKKYTSDKTAIMEPKSDINYEELIIIMDAVRMLRSTDESIYRKNKDGIDEKVKTLFDNIIFGNLMS